MAVTDTLAARGHRAESLRADCSRCTGLCCVALAFGRSPDFPVDKSAGEACRHLGGDHRCGIHSALRERGYRGCTVFHCLGAGQKVTQVTLGGRSWREQPGDGEVVFAAFQVMRSLHALLWYLDAALALPRAGALVPELLALYDEVEALTLSGADDVLATDAGALRVRVHALLSRASDLERSHARGGRGPSAAARRVQDEAGRASTGVAGLDLPGADLRGADLRGARLRAADLRQSDLGGADLLGADLTDADLGGADLSGALFLTPFQVAAARGDAATQLPPSVGRPEHWAP